MAENNIFMNVLYHKKKRCYLSHVMHRKFGLRIKKIEKAFQNYFPLFHLKRREPQLEIETMPFVFSVNSLPNVEIC